MKEKKPALGGAGNRDTEMDYECKDTKLIDGFFKINAASRWIEDAKKTPIPNKLFGDFFLEGDVCILFASTGVGKTVLAYQIADAITYGRKVLCFEPEIFPKKVIYFDFELSEKAFEKRYSKEFNDHYSFSPNFIRAEINPDMWMPDNKPFEILLIENIEMAVKEHEAKVIIIDNITFLGNELEKQKHALSLMKKLRELIKRHDLSILILAHTPKRDQTRPLQRNDLANSANIMNFADGAFAIGESAKDPGLRYLKQIKTRNDGAIYDSNNVMLCQIEKPNNFLQFSFISYDQEADHLSQSKAADKEDLEKKIQELHSTGMSLRKIGDELKISHMTVKRVLEKG